VALAQQNLGDVYRHLQRFDLAMEHLMQAIAIAKQIASEEVIILGTATLAEVYLAQGRLEEALTQGLESLNRIEHTHNQKQRPYRLRLLGRIYQALQRWAEARACFDEASRLWREREAWRDLSESLLSWAQLEQQQGQLNRARDLYAEVAVLAAKHNADDLIRQTADLQAELSRRFADN